MAGTLRGCAVLSGCQKPVDAHATAKVAPAKVDEIAQEGQLNKIVLTPEAEQRLAIETAEVTRQQVVRGRSFGGEIVLPSGASIIVSAPVSGTLETAADEHPPHVGTLVSQKQPIYRLNPLLSPERDVLMPAERLRLAEAKNAIATSKIDAANQVLQAEVTVEAARITLDRADRLFKESAGPARAVEDAKAQYEIATQSLEGAKARKKLIDGISLDEKSGESAAPIVIESPKAGMIRAQHAAVGELVATGAPLFEVMQFDPIWVRVPVYVGELTDVVATESAQICELSDKLGAKAVAAEPVEAPPTAVPLSSTIDLYFQLPNPDHVWRVGQRVTARLKLGEAQEQLTIPWSAVLHDINGGTWVYELTAPHTYVRRRVAVRYVADGLAVLQDGPTVGAKIVTVGAVELFGTEFGFAK